MDHIKTYFDMLSRILRDESDGDLMYYLESVNTPEEAMEVIKTLRDKLVDKSTEELEREMWKTKYLTKQDLMDRFEFLIEKQRWFPLWMWEFWDLEEWAEDWADWHWYSHLFREEEEPIAVEIEPLNLKWHPIYEEQFRYKAQHTVNWHEFVAKIWCWKDVFKAFTSDNNEVIVPYRESLEFKTLEEAENYAENILSVRKHFLHP